jgi:hypothetical protein
MAKPLIVAPGRILVVTATGLRGDHDMVRHPMPGIPFVIEEITLAGHAHVAQGYCPKATEAAALAQLRSGELAVACVGYGHSRACRSSDGSPCLGSVVDLGVVDRARHTVDWRWRMSIPYVAPPPNIYLVELGGRIGVVFPHWLDMHFPQSWGLAFGPDGGGIALGEEDGMVVEREILALGTAGDDLKILFDEPTEAKFLEVTIAPNGTKSFRTGRQVGQFSPGTSAPSCVSQDLDGTATVTEPTVRYERRSGDNYDTIPGTVTIRYPNARLSRGADAYPSPDRRCVGVRVANAGPTDDDRGAGPVRPVRATRVGRRELIVYETPADAEGNVTLRVERR